MKRRSFIKKVSASTFTLGSSQGELNTVFSSDSTKFILVKDCQAKVPIITAPGASFETRRAANDLAEYIWKTSGARPKVLHGTGIIPESAVWVGIQPILSNVFKGINLEFTKSQEILICCTNKHLLIAGRDHFFENVQIEFGTVNAVYTFLQKYLEVRWLWPGDLGEDIMCKTDIAFSPFNYRFAPPFLRRDIIRVVRSKEGEKWMRFQRLRYDSLKGQAGGHAFTTWWDRFHKDHPEWFALQPDGSRSGYPGARTVKMCLSNPEVWGQWLLDAEENIKKNPEISMIMAGENDSFATGLCVCESCRSWDHPDGSPFTYYWDGYKEEYVVMTNRYITFCNKVARKLKERFPERKDLYVQALAYGPSLEPPIDLKIEDNIIVSYVGFFPLIGDEIRKKTKQEFMEWAKLSKAMLYRPNYWYFTGGIWGLPDPAFKNTMEDFLFLAKNKCKGIFVDTAQEHWSTQGPQYYLMTQLAWDPYQDGQAVMDDYFKRGFGKAAGKMKEYWEMLENASQKVINSPKYPTGSAGRYLQIPFFGAIYTKEFFEKSGLLLKQAEIILKNEPEFYRKRVSFMKTGYEFTRLMMSNIALMAKVRETKGKDKIALNQVTENWKIIRELYEKSGPLSLNYESIMSKMKGTGYMGLMEDYFGPPADKYINSQ